MPSPIRGAASSGAVYFWVRDDVSWRAVTQYAAPMKNSHSRGLHGRFADRPQTSFASSVISALSTLETGRCSCVWYAPAHSYHPGPDELEPVMAADVTFGTARRCPSNIFRVHTCVSCFGPWTIFTRQDESNHREMKRSVTNFEDALQRDTRWRCSVYRSPSTTISSLSTRRAARRSTASVPARSVGAVYTDEVKGRQYIAALSKPSRTSAGTVRRTW